MFLTEILNVFFLFKKMLIFFFLCFSFTISFKLYLLNLISDHLITMTDFFHIEYQLRVGNSNAY